MSAGYRRAVVIAVAVFAFLSRRRPTRPGCWRACGYNLMGNVSGKCPERGEAKSQNQLGTPQLINGALAEPEQHTDHERADAGRLRLTRADGKTYDSTTPPGK